jgi:SAM-dependent methyltransferase
LSAVGLTEVASNLRRSFETRVRAGDTVECPCCERSFRAFRAIHGRPGAMCPACGALERHRLLWLFLDRELGVGSAQADLLHFAPEPALERRLRSALGSRYLSVDLRPGAADVAADITALPFEDGSFDLVLCNHVLEHVEDDRRALAEIRRVLRPDGRAVLMHPVDPTLSQTYEDPAITSPRERRRAFRQSDHVRIYGPDFGDRVAEAGFTAEAIRYAKRIDPADAGRFRLAGVEDDIYLCRPA